MTVEERFWSKVDKSGDCWIWTGSHDGKGYGVLAVERRNVRATHLSMELAGHVVSQDKLVMHVCDNPPCVRPDHLRVATHLDNMRDMFAKGRNRSIGKSYRTHCPAGHPYDEANTIQWTGRRTLRRVCRACEQAREARRPWRAR